MEENSNIKFKPFVGKYFGTKDSIFYEKVLVLGESHHNENPEGDLTIITNEVMQTLIYDYSGQPYERTFTCFEQALAGRVLEQKERERLWESMIFYNYLQVLLSQPREKVQAKHYEGAEAALNEVVETYKPDKIIVWGKRLYGALPGEGTEENLLVQDDETLIWKAVINGENVKCMRVHHPSSPSGKQWERWHPFYKEFLGTEYLTNLKNIK